MNAVDMARKAYSPTSAVLQSPRTAEYAVFARVTRMLSSASGTEKGGFSELAYALHENRVLWTRLAADVAEEENGLPEMLKARIFYLAKFTAQQTSKVLDGSGSPDVLVEINTAIMRGLNQQEPAR